MPDTEDLGRNLAVTRNDVHHLEQAIQALDAKVESRFGSMTQTINSLDAKLDLMGQTYLTTAEWGRWKREDYQPHKDGVDHQFQRLSERQTKWLGIIIGALITGSLTLTVYLIVQAVGSGMKP